MKENKAPPIEIQSALSALTLLKAENPGHDYTALEKILPAIAVRLQHAGQTVTPEVLLSHARQGQDHLNALKDQLSSSGKTQKRNYQDVVANLPSPVLPLDEQLVQSARDGQLDKLQESIVEGDKTAMLFAAAQSGDSDTVRLLIEAGVDIHAKIDWALLSAAQNGHADTVHLLIEAGADIHADNDFALRSAAEHGHADTVRLLIKARADIHADNNLALQTSATNGHADTVRLLIKAGADIHAHNDRALRLSARNGHADTVRLLIKAGADIHADNDFALRSAAQNGHTDIVRLLFESGADIHADNDLALQTSATNGHADTVRLLIKAGADIHVGHDWALRSAAENGHADTVRLLIDTGADIHVNNDQALQLSATNGYIETALLLIGAGANEDHLAAETRNHINQYRLWKKLFPELKDIACLSKYSPHFFKQSCYEETKKMLEIEGYKDETLKIYSYHISGLFRSEDRVLQYLEKWGTPGKQPLHDITHMITLPESGRPDLKAWGDAVLQHGPELAKYAHFSDRLIQPEHDASGKGWSYTKTKEKIAAFAIKNGHLNPRLASFCLDHGWNDDDYNSALKEIKKYQKKYSANDNRKPDARIPEVSIDGTSFGKQGYRFYKLPDGDLRGLLLGEFTNCCQHLAGEGSDCAKHGFLSEQGGFYVVADEKTDQIVAQSWAWRGQDNALVLDSFEYLAGHFDQQKAGNLCNAFAGAVKGQDKTGISRILIGTGGNTPSLAYPVSENPARPLDYKDYRDSHKQYLIADIAPGPFNPYR